MQLRMKQIQNNCFIYVYFTREQDLTIDH